MSTGEGMFRINWGLRRESFVSAGETIATQDWKPPPIFVPKYQH